MDPWGEQLAVQLVLAAGLWFHEHGPLFVDEGWCGRGGLQLPPGTKSTFAIRLDNLAGRALPEEEDGRERMTHSVRGCGGPGCQRVQDDE